MTKTILMLGAATAMTVVMATSSFAQKRNNAREAYAQGYSFNNGCTRLCGPPYAAPFWQPGMCWVNQRHDGRLGYFAACKK